MSREEGPVYYREIQKNAYLKRIPNDSGSKLRPLVSKKPALKPMWTLFCVHNGRIPFLEQYCDPDSPNTLTHRPLWRACLHTARHVTASVKPHTGEEYDFLVDCDQGPVRMLAPDWDSMQDWVTTLRTKLHELKILSHGENVYCMAPAAPPVRAPARDPTSPLPPTPPVPVPRVPGIELTAQATRTIQEPEAQPSTTAAEPSQQASAIETLSQPLVNENIDISNWEAPSDTNEHLDTVSTLDTSPSPMDVDIAPGTNQDSSSKDTKESKTKSVAKICGQNICLDDSILKRSTETTDSDEEFFAEIDRIHDSVENLTFDEISDTYISEVEASIGTRCSFRAYKQTLVVDGDEPGPSTSQSGPSTSRPGPSASQLGPSTSRSGPSTSSPGPSTSKSHSEPQPSNVTVIKVSNKPPHTAIPVMGPETDIFDFSFKQQLAVSDKDYQLNPSNLSNQDNFVNIVNTEVSVKNSEFPERNPEDGYGTVFEKEPDYGHISLTTTVSLTGDAKVTDGIYERLCMASTSNTVNALKASPLSVKKLRNQNKLRKSSLPNLDSSISDISYTNSESAYEYLFPNVSQSKSNNTNITLNSTETTSQVIVNGHVQNNLLNAESTAPKVAVTRNHMNSSNGPESPRHITSPAEVRNVSVISDLPPRATANNNREIANRPTPNSSEITNVNVTVTNSSHRSRNVERSYSQNAFDSANRLRDHLIKRVQNNSPTREGKNDKPEQSKPIWKRGLTELSLLSRLRGIGQRRHDSPTRRHGSPTRRHDSPTRRHDSPTRRHGSPTRRHDSPTRRHDSPTRRHDSPTRDGDRGVTSPVKVVHRSRPEGRVDGNRRRSSSLNNGATPPVPSLAMAPLRTRQAAALRAEQRRGAVHTVITRVEPPLLLDYNRQVWVAWWGSAGPRCSGRCGDRVVSVHGVAPRDAAHARHMVKHAIAPAVDILFHRVPLAKIYVLNKRDLESIGIKLDSECNITGIEPASPAARAGLPPPGRWAVTEVNNRPINLIKGGEEEMNRASLHGTEASVLIQPTALVKKLRAGIKSKACFR